MLTPDPAESVKALKGLAAALGLLLILSNVYWYIAYTTATGPLAKPTASPTVVVTLAPTPSATPTIISPSPTSIPTATTTPIR